MHVNHELTINLLNYTFIYLIFFKNTYDMKNEILFSVTPGLYKELESRKTIANEIDKYLSISNNYEAFVTYLNKWIPVKQVEFLEKDWDQNKKILDIGFGWGITSLYLAKCGHDITGVEPSIESINFVERAAKKFDLKLNTVNSTAEEMDKFLNEDFDIAIFNSSLHHCDDPIKGLKAAFEKLKNEGKIYLIEPTLRAWRSKSWYFKRMKNNPIKMGNYGGNEHIYRSNEYKKMLKLVGFKKINYIPVLAVTDFRVVVIQKLNLKIHECVLIEDSLRGVKAAEKIGMKFIILFCTIITENWRKEVRHSLI